MQSRFSLLLDRCRYKIDEEQFLSGRPAMFTINTLGIPGDGNSVRIIAFYKGGKVLIEAHTYWSLLHLVDISDGKKPDGVVLVDPIVVEDLTKLEELLGSIMKNMIATRQIEDKELQTRVGDEYLAETPEQPLW